MNITNVNIHNIFTEGKLKAIASIVIDNFIEVHDIKVVQGTDRLFVGMPSRKTVDGEFAARDFCMLTLFLNCGMRLSELVGISLSDIDRDLRSLRVVGKGNKERLAAFPKVTQDVVKEYLESGYRPNNLGEDDFVFGTNEDGWKQFDRFTLSQLVQRNIRLITGRDDCRSHSLRHASASWLLSSGVNVDSISSLLGHSNPQTTLIYCERLNPSSVSDEANSVFDRFNL